MRLMYKCIYVMYKCIYINIINVYCFKVQSLGVICYTAVDNKYSTIFTLNPALKTTGQHAMVSHFYRV